MTVYPLNQKSLEAIATKGFMKIYEGSVRAAKTVTSLIDWIGYATNSTENTFLMSGATMGSLARNCLDGDFGLISLCGKNEKGEDIAKKRTDTDQSKFVEIGNKKIYYCGSDNIGSFKKIRGLTIGGSYHDEINLHHKSFLETAFARSFASTDRCIMGTLNPDSPSHWLYKEYLNPYEENKIKGYNWFHFTLDDNPAITPERKAEIASQYSGVFYQRYVLGLRVTAEGACYPSFSEKNILTEVPEKIAYVIIGSDVGGTGSANTFSAVGYYYNKLNQWCAVLLDEFYKKIPNMKVEEYISDYKNFVIRQRQAGYIVIDGYAESSEQLIKNSLDNLGILNIHNSQKKRIIDRIRFCDLHFATGRLGIMSHCTETIDAIKGAVFDLKSLEEKRLDNGTTNIDSLDALEYALEPEMESF